MNLLWHKDIRLPPNMGALPLKADLDYSAHAVQACETDRYGTIRQFKTLTLSRFEVVEVETCDGAVVKVVVRGAYSDLLDVVLALVPGERFLVKTVWLNRKYDTHSTLDASKYVK